MTLSNIYLLCAAVSVIEFILLFTSSENRLQDIYMTMIVALIAIANFGYFFLSLSTTLETALLANRIAYIGGVWIPFCSFMTVTKLCGLKIRPMAVRLLAIFNLSVFAFAMTVGYMDIYYVQTSLEFIDGTTAIKTVYGPVHSLFYIMLVIETALPIFVVVYTCLIKRKSIPLIVVVLTILAVVLPRTVYIIRRIFNFHMDIMPITYTISGTLFCLAYSRMNLYDLTLLIARSHIKSKEHGFIAFDENKRLLSFNESAGNFFPILNESRIGSEIDKSSSLHNEIVMRLSNITANDTSSPVVLHHEIDINENLFLKVNIFLLAMSNWMSIFSRKYYLVELVDSTTEHNYILMQENFNSILHNTLDKQLAHMQAVHDSIVRSMSFIIANRDGNTGQHVVQTSKSVKIFLDALAASPTFNLPKSFCEKIEKAAPLHDIGKIGVDDAILRKPGKFSHAEYDIMKRHPEIGAEIIDQVFAETDDDEFKNIAKNVAHYHHEKWDGTGYPDGLKGEEIPLEARIMALADVFDALASERVYKKSYSYEDAFSIIEESINTQFDPVLCEVFLSIKPKLIALYGEMVTEE